MKRFLWILLVLILLGGIAAYVYFFFLRPPGPLPPPPVEAPTMEDIEEQTAGRPVPEPETERTLTAFDDEEHIRGNPDATLSIVEYADFENIYAALMHPELLKYVEENRDVNWVFRHYPLDARELDWPGAVASECVHRQLGNDGFWAYVDMVYDRTLFFEEDVVEFAVEVGADEARLRECIETDETLASVVDDKYFAQIYGSIYMVPSFLFINNRTGELRYVEGADTMDFVKRVVEEML